MTNSTISAKSKKHSSITVMQVVANQSECSIPLEVSNHMSCEDVRVTVAIYYKDKNSKKAKVSPRTRNVDAKSKYDVCAINRLSEAIKAEEPDIVHVHHTVSSFFAALICYIQDIPVVRTEHDDHQHYNLFQNMLSLIVELIADIVICNSQDTLENLTYLQKQAVKNKYRVIYNGINIDRIESASSKKITSNQLNRFVNDNDNVIVGSVGRLIRQKNYENLIKAAEIMKKKYTSNFKIAIVGDGEKRGKLEKLVNEKKLGSSILLPGEIRRDEVYAFLKCIDVYVMMSSWEGFCNAVVEAMAAGNPIVCSNISTLKEVVGDVGHYASPDEPSDIASTIYNVIRWNESDYFDEDAKYRASSRYSLKSTSNRYVKTYKEIYDKHHQ